MVARHPHVVVYSIPTPGEAVSGRDGWAKGLGETEEVELPCRLSVNEAGGSGGAKTIASEDGTGTVFSFKLHLSADAPKMTEGTAVTVYSGPAKEEVIGSGKVKRFIKGQFNVRVWV